MQNWANHVQCLRDKQTQRSKNQEKNKKLVTQAESNIEEQRNTIEELKQKNLEDAGVWKEVEDCVQELSAKHEGRKAGDASWQPQAAGLTVGSYPSGCPDAEWLADNFHKLEAEAQDHVGKVCTTEFRGAAEVRYEAEQEAKRPAPVHGGTTEPATGRGKGHEQEEPTSPPLQTSALLDVMGDIDSELDADM